MFLIWKVCRSLLVLRCFQLSPFLLLTIGNVGGERWWFWNCPLKRPPKDKLEKKTSIYIYEQGQWENEIRTTIVPGLVPSRMHCVCVCVCVSVCMCEWVNVCVCVCVCVYAPASKPKGPPFAHTYNTTITFDLSHDHRDALRKEVESHSFFSPSLPFAQITNTVAGLSFGPLATSASVEISERLRFEREKGGEARGARREARPSQGPWNPPLAVEYSAGIEQR